MWHLGSSWGGHRRDAELGGGRRSVLAPGPRSNTRGRAVHPCVMCSAWLASVFVLVEPDSLGPMPSLTARGLRPKARQHEMKHQDAQKRGSDQVMP